jgi:hypothetical protein
MNKRQSLRFDKVFPVMVSSDEFGDANAMARNVSAGGILLELSDPLPLGTRVRIHFSMNVPMSEHDRGPTIVARGEVKNHYFLNYCDPTGPRSMTGMAVRFTEFETASRDHFAEEIGQLRVMH